MGDQKHDVHRIKRYFVFGGLIFGAVSGVLLGFDFAGLEGSIAGAIAGLVVGAGVGRLLAIPHGSSGFYLLVFGFTIFLVRTILDGQ